MSDQSVTQPVETGRKITNPREEFHEHKKDSMTEDNKTIEGTITEKDYDKVIRNHLSIKKTYYQEVKNEGYALGIFSIILLFIVFLYFDMNVNYIFFIGGILTIVSISFVFIQMQQNAIDKIDDTIDEL